VKKNKIKIVQRLANLWAKEYMVSCFLTAGMHCARWRRCFLFCFMPRATWRGTKRWCCL